MKDIVKIVHLPSVAQSDFNEATRTLFLCKENKNNDFIQQFVSSASSFWRISAGRNACSSVSQGYIIYACLRFDLDGNGVSGLQLTQNSVCCLRPADILQNDDMLKQRIQIDE